MEDGLEVGIDKVTGKTGCCTAALWRSASDVTGEWHPYHFPHIVHLHHFEVLLLSVLESEESEELE